jgi:hypothetical protein
LFQNMKNAILHLNIVFHALEEMSKKNYTHNQMYSLSSVEQILKRRLLLILNLFRGRICLHIHYFVLVTCGNLDIFVSVIENLPQFSKFSWLTSGTQCLSASKNYSNNLFPI